MGMLLVFAAGYVMGSRAGGESFDDVVEAMHAIRQSEEFQDFVKAVRTHAAHSLRELAAIVETRRDPIEEPGESTDLLERVRLIAGWRRG